MLIEGRSCGVLTWVTFVFRLRVWTWVSGPNRGVCSRVKAVSKVVLVCISTGYYCVLSLACPSYVSRIKGNKSYLVQPINSFLVRLLLLL